MKKGIQVGHAETEVGGMFLVSGRLYGSLRRAYHTQFQIICKDLYVIRTVRLIRDAPHTNRVSTLCWCIFFILPSGCSGSYENFIHSAQMSCIHCGPCVDFYWSELTICYALIRMSSVQSELKYAPYETQAEWSESRVWHVRKCPEHYRTVPSRTAPNRHEPHTLYESN